MFGFWSFLPLSTSEIIFYNGHDEELILYIQQEDSKTRNICSVISIDMTIEKDPLVIL
jgi:hypothetical protein